MKTILRMIKMNHIGIRLVVAGMLVMFVGGCFTKVEMQKDPLFESWRQKGQQAKTPPTEKPEPPAEQKMATVQATPNALAAPEAIKRQKTADAVVLPKMPLPSQKISLKMHDVEVAVLLRALARVANQNLMISENVQGKTSLTVNDAPWDQVFYSILNTNSLRLVQEGEILRVVALKDLENMAKLLEADQQLSIAQKEYQLKMDTLHTRVRMNAPLTSHVYHVKYADSKTLRDKLEAYLQSSHSEDASDGTDDTQNKENSAMRGGVLLDPHTNSLIVEATERDLQRIKKLIAQLDRPTRQVMIEAHIVEAERGVSKALGVRWGGLYYRHTKNNVNNWVTAGSNASTGLSGDTNEVVANPTVGNVVDMAAGSIGGVAPASIGFLTQIAGESLLNVELTALEDRGRLNILSSPSITTLDNQEALIESGRDVPFQTVEDGEVNIEFKKAVLSLKVTPYVVDGKTLKLEIETSKDELDFSNAVAGNPAIITKKAQTTVILSNGQTTVIGGLTRETATADDNGVPGLQEIPLLKYLFQSKSKSKQKEDLLIFITPHIL